MSSFALSKREFQERMHSGQSCGNFLDDHRGKSEIVKRLFEW